MRSIFSILLLTLFLLSTSPLTAQEKATDGDWQFNLAPFYLWAFSIDGDLSVGTDRLPGTIAPTIPLDVPFSDVLDNLEAAFIVHFEAMHKNNWGVLVDVNYLNVSNDFTNSMGLGLDVGLELTLAEVAALYRVNRDVHAFDALLGLRGYRMNPEVSLLRGPTLSDQTQDWLDPFVGGRWTWNFAENWSISARGDIGGFGIGSDLAWQAIGLVQWQPFKHVSFVGGYKTLNIDYESGSGSDYFNFDAAIDGPVIGINFRW